MSHRIESPRKRRERRQRIAAVFLFLGSAMMIVGFFGAHAIADHYNPGRPPTLEATAAGILFGALWALPAVFYLED